MVKNKNLLCPLCEKPRIMQDVVSGIYDVYFKLDGAYSLMRVGLCKDCFAIHESVKLDDAHKKVLDHNEATATVLDHFKKKWLEGIRKDKFTGIVGVKKYWVDLEKKHGQNPEKKLSGKQFVDEVKNK